MWRYKCGILIYEYLCLDICMVDCIFMVVYTVGCIFFCCLYGWLFIQVVVYTVGIIQEFVGWLEMKV